MTDVIFTDNDELLAAMGGQSPPPEDFLVDIRTRLENGEISEIDLIGIISDFMQQKHEIKKRTH